MPCVVLGPVPENSRVQEYEFKTEQSMQRHY